METYHVFSDGKSVGSAEVTRQGLYYIINCFCNGTFQPHCRIAIALPAGRIDLGLCVPLDEGFGLHSRIPVKRIGNQKPEFLLLEPKQQNSVLFIPIEEDKPFGYISKLKNARFTVCNGKTGIELTND